MRFKVVLEPSDEGGFTVYVPFEVDWIVDERALVQEIEL